MSWMFLNSLGRNYILREHWSISIGYIIEDWTAPHIPNKSKWETGICSESTFRADLNPKVKYSGIKVSRLLPESRKPRVLT